MSAVRKLVIASVLVATGLGVAFLLGEPTAIQRVFASVATPAPSSAQATAATEPKTAASLAPVRAQLLPETAVPLSTAQPAPEPPALLSSLAPVAAPSAEPPGRDATPAIENRTTPVTRSFGGGAPIAKLRDEAPRPLGNEPRSPAVMRRMPPVDSVGSAIAPIDSKRVNTASADWSGSQTAPTSFAGDTNPTSATAAAFNVPVTDREQEAVGPPPWPAGGEPPGPRTHVIVDGDSLDRLASRYLDDPQRGREIYELNREVLTNPDLLPIGAELKIPERVARSSWGRQGHRPSAASDATIRSAANGNLVPIRSAITQDPHDVTVPRAVLASPIAIE